MAHGDTGLFIPETLLGRIRKRQCVAFVGAGFSMSCGMPAWRQLLAALLEAAKGCHPSRPDTGHMRACEQAIADGSFAMAASLLRDLMTPSDLDEAIRGQFGLHRLHQAKDAARERTEARARNLVTAPWAGIVTTNYDELIEHGIKHRRIECVEAHGDDPRLGTILAQPPAGSFFFVKIHGSVSGSRVVLSTEEYDRVYLAAPQMTAFLTALMLRYYIVFIGCSLEDEILRLRRGLCQHFERLIPPAYAILPENPQNLSRLSWLRTQAMVECVFYSPDDPTHQAVDDFLAAAAACAEEPPKAPGGATHTELKNMSVEERLNSIGSVNRELVQVVVNQPNHTLPHLHLISLERLKDPNIGQSLIETTEAERTYRMFFLVSINLINEERLDDGTHIYKITDKQVLAYFDKAQRGR